ncbi:unnamed protein product [Linum tenue]|uniref:General transcription and DNA repair factor IIH subunit TFB5 n=1 Tax=Linum tenue TaxID=586396 RepID=A0AAV0N452_9ROSI|nr:unnamed protein product [Linum tenue]
MVHLDSYAAAGEKSYPLSFSSFNRQQWQPAEKSGACLGSLSLLLLLWFKMANATKGLFIACDIPMAQFIVNLNASKPPSQKFIIHVLDDTHLLVQPDSGGTIRAAISEFRDKNSYEKPA